MKYLLLMTESGNVINFRKTLINFLKEKGHLVSVVAHDDKREEDIRALGVEFYCAKQNNRGLNPFSIFGYINRLKEIIKIEKPDVVLTFQLKPNVFGAPIAKKVCKCKVFSAVEGLGDVYINNSFKWKMIRFVVNNLYKSAFRKADKVFFLNEEDKKEFINRKLCKEEKAQLIFGTGVDTKHFSYKPLKNNARFIMVARMLKTKGVYEYCKCAEIVKQKYPNAQFDYLGAEGTITKEDLKYYIENGIINHLGTTKDVRPYLEETSVLILPSYREGFSVSIMEALSVGRAVIASSTAGCKDAIEEGVNGFLVKVGDYEDLAKKAIWCIENPEELEKMCQNARNFAEQKLDCDIINNQIYKVVNQD